MQKQELVPKELIISLKKGDKKAFTTIYKLYWPKIYNFARLYLSSVSEAEEVVQEIFVKLWEARLFLNENEYFDGFLFIITRNAIFNQKRRSFNENHYKATILGGCEMEYTIEDELDSADLQTYIKKLIDELPPRQKEVFKLSRENYLSYKEIAVQLSISEKTVERHINEALKFLRKNIHMLILFLS